MKVSYNWLNELFEQKLPSPEKVGELLTKHCFELEGLEKVALPDNAEDTILAIDVLPNRSPDCFSHRGIAREIALALDLPIVPRELLPIRISAEPAPLVVEETILCSRYVGRIIKGVKVCPSPAWMQNSLLALGQRPINNIVDSANYVMFYLGQPLHAFDLEQLDLGTSGITVRLSRAGERIETLDGMDIELDPETLVIADNKGPIAIAGIKGGSRAAVVAETTSLYLESANFNGASIRRATRRLGIRSDASIRFEHGLSPHLAEEAMNMFTSLIIETSGGEVSVGELGNHFPHRAKRFKIGFGLEELRGFLGAEISSGEVEHILNKLRAYSGFEWQKVQPRERFLEIAPKYEGVEYKSPCRITYDAPNYFDCSSLTAFLASEVGIQIPRISVDQYVFGEPIEKSDLRAGDLVFVNNGEEKFQKIWWETKEYLPKTPVPEGINHVGIFLGEDKIMHATRGVGRVVVESFSGNPAFEKTVGYRRILGDKGERYVVEAPLERLDLRSPRGFYTGGVAQDIIEEIGRLYGYDKIEATPLPDFKERPVQHALVYLKEKFSYCLVQSGFSEVYTYTFTNDIDRVDAVLMQNPISDDKKYLRTSLTPGLRAALQQGVLNKDLVGVPSVMIFEIGEVFSEAGEDVRVGIAMEKVNKKHDVSAEVMKIAERLFECAGVKASVQMPVDGVLEFSLQDIARNYANSDYAALPPETDASVVYKPFSAFPFVTRDIALFVGKREDGEVVEALIRKVAGELLGAVRLFDVFEKAEEDGSSKVSLAYRLVFQSFERTLTGEEISVIMENVYTEIRGRGWTVR